MGKQCLIDPRRLLRFDFGAHHPFKIERLGLTFDLMGALGLIDLPSVYMKTPHLATEEEAARFHSQGYLETLRLASTGMWVPQLFSHGLTSSDNPVFPDVYDWAMSVAGASIQCAREVLTGQASRAFNMSGGLHHAMPSRASGFCHINDGVLAIQELVRHGRRVVYVDIDAHHGDGVESAFYATSDVLTISIHQTGHTIFPGTGFAEDIGEGEGLGYALNIPLLPGAGDEAYERAFEELILPAIGRFEPDILVTQLGADAILGDVLANLRMSLVQFERCVAHFRALDLPWVALGGGGYDVGNVVRAWTLAWGVICDRHVGDDVPESWMTGAAPHGVAVSRMRGDNRKTPTPAAVLDDLDDTISSLIDTAFELIGARHP